MSDGAPPFLVAGSKIGPYVIVRALDAGGMGEVYEARDTRLDRRIALKVVRHELASDAARRQRLEREARAAAALNHPHIVTLHSLEEHGGVLFLTMELIDGITLRDAVPPHGLTGDQFLRTAIQLTAAVAAAHEAGIIHRDLKPANIMIARTGGVNTPPLVRDLNSAVPLELAQMIEGCLVKNPSQRRQSVADLHTDLENLATRSGEPREPGSG